MTEVYTIDYNNNTKETRIIVYYLIQLNILKVILRRTLDIHFFYKLLLKAELCYR